VPWAVVSVIRREPLLIRSPELAFVFLLLTITALMFVRWVIVVSGILLSRNQ
jgi:hypothetical protein